jgi:hypothetical protein
MAKQTTITIETRSLLILQSRHSKRAMCPLCGVEVEMISLAGEELSTFDQWLKSGDVHQSEAPDGTALICLNALLARMQATKTANFGFPRLPNTKKERI